MKTKTIKPEINGRINKTNSQKNSEVEQARVILRTLGHMVATVYLKKRGWTLDGVLWALFKREQQFENLAMKGA